MKEKWYKCFVCGQEYKESNITPLNYYDKYSGKWSEITKISYCGKHLPLCSEHLRMLLICRAINEYKTIDIDGEHINE